MPIPSIFAVMAGGTAILVTFCFVGMFSALWWYRKYQKAKSQVRQAEDIEVSCIFFDQKHVCVYVCVEA